MYIKRQLILIIAILIVALIVFIWNNKESSNQFVNYPLTLKETHKLMDFGVVDVNNDNRLDIYTSNHNFQQALLIANKDGKYRDVLDEWGLSQSRDFPRIELSYKPVKLDDAGLYIYWLGSGGNEELGHNIIIQTHKASDLGKWNGLLQINAPVYITKNDGFNVDIQPQASSLDITTVNFTANNDATLSLMLTTWGLPIYFDIHGEVNPSQIHIGRNKKSPRTTSFTMALQDRHGFAWADYNNDGKLDVYITRGALGGRLKSYPDNIQHSIKDAFFVSNENEKYDEFVIQAGFEKKGCSGRHVNWVDFNQDGLLDLFINCQERGRIDAEFPKQLYQQYEDARFVDVATNVGLGIPANQLIDYTWLDADNDGDTDLLSTEDQGFFLYRNQSGHYTREYIGRGNFARADRPGLKYVTQDYWNFDGKLTISDYDQDGDLDALSVSKEGNTLLVNEAGTYTVIDPVTIGLPFKSVGGNWVDYDNDGLIDFHAVPDGLFRQRTDHSFETMNLLVLPSHKYMAAISNWADLDNDGIREVAIALNENPSLWRWWEKPFRSPQDSFRWKFQTYRNINSDNNWLQVKLKGSSGNRQAIGARVTVVTQNSQQMMEVGNNEGSFFSQGHYRLYFGLGQNNKIIMVKIRWPDGSIQELKNVPVNRLLIVEKEDIVNNDRSQTHQELTTH